MSPIIKIVMIDFINKAFFSSTETGNCTIWIINLLTIPHAYYDIDSEITCKKIKIKITGQYFFIAFRQYKVLSKSLKWTYNGFSLLELNIFLPPINSPIFFIIFYHIISLNNIDIFPNLKLISSIYNILYKTSSLLFQKVL